MADEAPVATGEDVPEDMAGIKLPANMTQEDLEEALAAVRQEMAEKVTVTDDLDDILYAEDGSIPLPPIATGLTDANGHSVYMNVTVRDTRDPSVLANYLDNEEKDRDAATKDLFQAMVIKPDNLYKDEVYNRLPSGFRESLVPQLLRVGGIDGFFERLKIMGRPELLQVAATLSSQSRKHTVKAQQR